MKRRSVIATLALMSALPVMMYAQPRGPGGGGGNRLDFLAGFLSLSETQKTQAQAIFDAAESAGETARGQMTAANDALKAAVKANAPDADLDRLAAAIGTIHGQMAGIQAKASAKLYAILNADQKAKYDTFGDRMGGGPGKGQRGGRGKR